ncbi:MAG: hypothetical protein AB1698_16170 [Pseudomonadota bacterium]
MARHSSAIIGDLRVVLPRGIEATWAAILQLDDIGPWAVVDVVGQSHQGKKETYAYVRALVANGRAQQVGTRAGGCSHLNTADVPLYRLTRRLAEAPRYGKDGKPARATGQQQLWNAMRALPGGYDYRELALAASTDETVISPDTAKAYLKRLLAAGYLVVVRPGRPRHAAIVALKAGMKTRPLAPQIMRTKFIWDPNVRAVVGMGETAEEVRS